MPYQLVTFDTPSGARAGVVFNGRVHDAEALAGNPACATMLGILDDWAAADARFAALAQQAAPDGGIPLANVKLLAPVLRPGQIWAAGANYSDHIGEMDEFKAVNAKTVSGGRAWHFNKGSRGAVTGPGSTVALPAYSEKVDWEVELAVVIGREGANIAAADALDYVAGYTITNDLSARDYVMRPGIAPESPFKFDWLSHKGFTDSCPMGPWLVPARYVEDPHNLDLKLWIDGEIMQDSNTRYMIFDIGEQIEEISARVTIYPGDIIMTGTPSGVGMGRGIFLKSGQNLRLYIEHIGELEHSVV